MKNWAYLINLSISALISEEKLKEFKQFLSGKTSGEMLDEELKEQEDEPDLNEWGKL